MVRIDKSEVAERRRSSGDEDICFYQSCCYLWDGGFQNSDGKRYDWWKQSTIRRIPKHLRF